MKLVKAAILSEIIYPLFMLPAMGFLLIQVYEINARSSADHDTVKAHEVRIGVIEQNVLTHLVDHSGPSDGIPIGLPLIKLPDRRSGPRVKGG